MAFENSQGIGFTFNGVAYTMTSISVSRNQGEFDVSTLDLAEHSFRRLRAGAFHGVEAKVDFLGNTLPPTKTLATIVFTGTDIGNVAFSGLSAVCTGLSYTANAGELIRGSATFKISQN